jgi:hypothetical protein
MNRGRPALALSLLSLPSLALLALAGWSPAGALAAQEPVATPPVPRARFVLRLDGDDGVPLPAARAAIVEPDGRNVPFALREDGTLESELRDLPLDARIRIGAADRADLSFRAAFGRSDGGIVDLGAIRLDAGDAVTLRVVDEADRPLEGAAIHLPQRGAAFPPQDPDGRHPRRTVLDATSLAGRTDATGSLRLGLRREDRAFVVVAAGYAPAFHVADPAVERGDEERVAMDRGVSLVLRPVAAREATQDDAGFAARRSLLAAIARSGLLATLDLGGVLLEVPLAFETDTEIRLDRARDLRVVLDVRGARSVSRDVAASELEAPIELPITPLPLVAARTRAVEAVTGRPLTASSLRLGKARQRDRDRIDFAPDWNSFALPSDEPPTAGLLCVAPAAPLDALVAADGYLETLVRGLRFMGTLDAPTLLDVELQTALPVRVAVTGKDGQPLPGAVVIVRKVTRDLADLPLAWKLTGAVGWLAAATTGEDGIARFRPSAWEDLAFEVAAEGHAATVFGPFERRRATDLRLALGAGHTVAGRADDAEAGDCVYLVDSVTPRRLRATLSEDRTFAFEHVAAGRYLLHVGPDDRAQLSGVYGPEGLASIEALHSRGVEIEVAGDVEGLTALRAGGS